MMQQANPREAAFRRFQVKYHMWHAYDPETKQWLHLSGSGLTKDRAYAWCGYDHQLECLKARAGITGKMAAILRRLVLIAPDAADESLTFQSQKENLEEFFNE